MFKMSPREHHELGFAVLTLAVSLLAMERMFAWRLRTRSRKPAAEPSRPEIPSLLRSLPLLAYPSLGKDRIEWGMEAGTRDAAPSLGRNTADVEALPLPPCAEASENFHAGIRQPSARI